MDIIDVDIQSDIDQCIREVGDFLEGQVPFAVGGAINSTLFDVRRAIVEGEYPRAFKVRNTRFPGAAFKVDKIPLGGSNSPIRAFKYGAAGGIFGSVAQKIDRDFLVNHVAGAVKTSRSGGQLAIPATPDAMRTKAGRIAKRNKPRAIIQRKGHYLIKGAGGKKRFIAKRTGDTSEIVYRFTDDAKIKPSFRFFQVAFKVADRVFPRYLGTSMAKAIKSSRFT